MLTLKPGQYVYEEDGHKWCMGIYNNGRNGAVIGAATMRNHEVIFDRIKRRVAFVPSDCEDGAGPCPFSKGATTSPAARSLSHRRGRRRRP